MTDENKLPPPPERPDPSECCGSGCVPCILELYEDELERWQAEIERLKQQDTEGRPHGRSR